MGFRPLPGDLISQLQAVIFVMWHCHRVSVPFPGILFLNDIVISQWNKLDTVSVPFPGILFLNFENVLFTSYSDAVFPSPFRGSYFSIWLKNYIGLNGELCFRPLSGDLISQFVLALSGKLCDDGFRPLSGDLISQLKYNKLVTQRSLVSVPFPGILFLNERRFLC